jgi:hypothetical protein
LADVSWICFDMQFFDRKWFRTFPQNLLFNHNIVSGTVLGIQMKFWAGEALETVNCFAFLKCRVTVVVIRAC